MSATIIDGKSIARELTDSLKTRVADLTLEWRAPKLVVVHINDNPASNVYVRNKKKKCEELGIKCEILDKDFLDRIRFPGETLEHCLLSVINDLNHDKITDGIMVQLPLPDEIDPDAVLNAISPKKDVDGFHPTNIGNLVLNTIHRYSESCTPAGIMHLLRKTIPCLSGLHAVVVGRSNIVGKPLAAMLLNEDCTVTVCHSKTKNLEEILKTADIVIAAVGKPEMIKSHMIKDGAVVIDVGINRVDGKLVGDVEFDTVSEVADAITPVPGGVGPMTIAMLMNNVVEAAEKNATEEIVNSDRA